MQEKVAYESLGHHVHRLLCEPLSMYFQKMLDSYLIRCQVNKSMKLYCWLVLCVELDAANRTQIYGEKQIEVGADRQSAVI